MTTSLYGDVLQLYLLSRDRQLSLVHCFGTIYLLPCIILTLNWTNSNDYWTVPVLKMCVWSLIRWVS